MTIDRVLRVEQVLSQRQPDLILVGDGVHKPHNLSALIRTCDAVGIGEVHCVLPRRFRPRGGTTMGSHRWVDLHFHDEPPGPLAKFKSNGYQVVCAHVGGDAVDFRDVDYTQPTVLVMGAEKLGTSPEARALTDVEVYIPMHGMVESYNVSVAGAIILSEAVRQRESAGLYDHCRLAPSVYSDLRFRWLQPKIAALCDEWGVAFPELDESGDVVDPSGWLKKNKPS